MTVQVEEEFLYLENDERLKKPAQAAVGAVGASVRDSLERCPPVVPCWWGRNRASAIESRRSQASVRDAKGPVLVEPMFS